MTIFLVVPTILDAEYAQLRAALNQQQDAGKLKYLELPRGEYVVSYRGTSQELSDELGISDGQSGSAVVASINSYFGRASTNIWEWIQAHWEG